MMGISWDYHGNIMGLLDYDGNIMGLSWEYHGTIRL